MSSYDIEGVKQSLLEQVASSQAPRQYREEGDGGGSEIELRKTMSREKKKKGKGNMSGRQ